jgi:integrase
MPRKGENIFKRSDGRWEGRYKVGRKPDGKLKYRSVYGKSYREVKEVMEQRKRIEYRNPPRCILSVQDLMESWLSIHAIEVKKSTYYTYERIIRCHILPFFKGVRVDSLSPEIIASFIRTLQLSGRKDGKEGGLSEKTISCICQVLRSAIKFANRRYGLNSDSLLEIKAPTPKQNNIEILGDNECETIFKNVLSDPDIKGIAILLALCYGLRIGEICGLKWSDISYVEKTLTVNRTAMRLPSDNHTQLTVQTPKSENSNRTIPITTDMAELLSSFQKGQPDEVYILTGRKNRPYDPRSLSYSFQEYLKKCGLPKHTFHALRHTFATRVIGKGYDPKAVSEILGHKNVKTTLALYDHPTMTHKRKIVDAASPFPEI